MGYRKTLTPIEMRTDRVRTGLAIKEKIPDQDTLNENI